MPLISIIVPVFNAEMYLEQCVQSLLSQTYKNMEIILVDDGSRDKSGELCDRYAQTIPSIVKAVHQANQGVSVARNTGLGVAIGEYVMFVDSDDWLEPETVETMLTHAEAEGCDISICGYYIEFPDRSIRNNIEKLAGRRITPDEKTGLIKRLLVTTTWIGGYGEKANLMGVWAKLFRRSLITDNNIMFRQGVDFSEDILFNLYAIQLSKKTGFCGGAFYHYRSHPSSATRHYQENILLSADSFLKELDIFANNFYQKKDVSDIYNVGVVYITRASIIMRYMVMDAPFSLVQKAREIKHVKNLVKYKQALWNAPFKYLSHGMQLYLLLIKLTPAIIFCATFQTIIRKQGR